MAIPLSDLNPIMAQDSIDELPEIRTNTAGGRAFARCSTLEVRVLTRDTTKEIIPWHTVKCNFYDNISRRIFRGALETNWFVCNHPHRQRLYVARTKDQLLRRMPKN